VGEIELPAPGLGSLNYDLYLKRLAEKHPNIPVIIEHLDLSDIPRAKAFLDGKFKANGV
jgi:sugar phosphate isomerase/epimerase